MDMLNETVNYTNWVFGEPNNIDSAPWSDDEGDCVRILSGKWFDTSCFRS